MRRGVEILLAPLDPVHLHFPQFPVFFLPIGVAYLVFVAGPSFGGLRFGLASELLDIISLIATVACLQFVLCNRVVDMTYMSSHFPHPRHAEKLVHVDGGCAET
jgi:hypothetical protein